MLLLVEILVEALIWIVLLLLRILFELVAEVFARGLIWLLAWIFRATGRQITLGSRALQLMIGVRLANAGWYEEALSVLPDLDPDTPLDKPRPRAFALTRGWLRARRSEWEDVAREVEALTQPDIPSALPPRSATLLAELAWATGNKDAARSALAVALQDDWNPDRAALLDELTAGAEHEAVWPGWPSKLRIKYGPMSVGETKLHRAVRKLGAGWRAAKTEGKYAKALAKLERVSKIAPESLVAKLAEVDLPRLRAETGMYR